MSKYFTANCLTNIFFECFHSSPAGKKALSYFSKKNLKNYILEFEPYPQRDKYTLYSIFESYFKYVNPQKANNSLENIWKKFFDTFKENEHNILAQAINCYWNQPTYRNSNFQLNGVRKKRKYYKVKNKFNYFALKLICKKKKKNNIKPHFKKYIIKAECKNLYLNLKAIYLMNPLKTPYRNTYSIKPDFARKLFSLNDLTAAFANIYVSINQNDFADLTDLTIYDYPFPLSWTSSIDISYPPLYSSDTFTKAERDQCAFLKDRIVDFIYEIQLCSRKTRRNKHSISKTEIQLTRYCWGSVLNTLRTENVAPLLLHPMSSQKRFPNGDKRLFEASIDIGLLISAQFKDLYPDLLDECKINELLYYEKAIEKEIANLHSINYVIAYMPFILYSYLTCIQNVDFKGQIYAFQKNSIDINGTPEMRYETMKTLLRSKFIYKNNESCISFQELEFALLLYRFCMDACRKTFPQLINLHQSTLLLLDSFCAKSLSKTEKNNRGTKRIHTSDSLFPKEFWYLLSEA